MNHLLRQGLLRGGVHARWSWTHCEEVAFVEMLVGLGLLHLEGVDYRYEAREINHTVSTTSTPCHYGGTRPWFLCPNCGRRAKRSGRRTALQP